MKNKFTHITLITLGIAALYVLPSCSKFSKKEPVVINEPAPLYPDYTKATIINYTLDGCSWMLQLESGKKLEPKNLAQEFKKEGLQVWIKYSNYENYSFCMAGQMVTINKIAIRK